MLFNSSSSQERTKTASENPQSMPPSTYTTKCVSPNAYLEQRACTVHLFSFPDFENSDKHNNGNVSTFLEHLVTGAHIKDSFFKFFNSNNTVACQ